MPTPPSDESNDNAEILARLRASFGEGRCAEAVQMDGNRLWAVLLRRLPEEGDSDEGRRIPTSELPEVRRRWRQARRVKSQTQALAKVPRKLELTAAEGAFPGVGALIDALPQVQENFAEWLANADTDGMLSASSLEELETARGKTEYRLRLLQMMVHRSQAELDGLIMEIKSREPTN